MSVLDALRLGVRVADKVTKSVQADVTFYKAVADTTGYGAWTYPSSVTLKAIVDATQRQVRTMSGVLDISRARVTFLDVTALLAATSGVGIKQDDRIVLPDGTTGPILTLSGFVDAGTRQFLATEVSLG